MYQYSLCILIAAFVFTLTQAPPKHEISLHLKPESFNRDNYQISKMTPIGRENATILMLCRNWELPGVLSSMRSLEDRFNSKYRYPWTFLNDVPFDETFIRETSAMASGRTSYHLIPQDDWDRPSWINETLFEETLENAVKNDVLYGGSKSYRNMCRFNSGFFFRQKALENYDWYFRVEPEVEYLCDFPYDPFTVMREQNKSYGFVITIHEFENTIPTLWNTVDQFMQQYPQHIHPNSAIDFITTDEFIGPVGVVMESSSKYNLCHFWSNFEIGNLGFFRSQAYMDFFQFLDKTGNFYYERWGDAPVHSIAVSLLLDKKQVHHFEDLGYYHVPFMTCPSSSGVRSANRCICKKDHEAIDVEPMSCLNRWWKYGPGKTFLEG